MQSSSSGGVNVVFRYSMTKLNHSNFSVLNWGNVAASYVSMLKLLVDGAFIELGDY